MIDSDASEGIDERPPLAHDQTRPGIPGRRQPDAGRHTAAIVGGVGTLQSQPVAAEEGAGAGVIQGTAAAMRTCRRHVRTPRAAETPLTASTADHPQPPTAGTALLAFRLHSGWNQRADQLLEVFFKRLRSANETRCLASTQGLNIARPRQEPFLI